MERITDELFYREMFDRDNPGDEYRHFQIVCVACEKTSAASFDTTQMRITGYEATINAAFLGGHPMMELAEDCPHAQAFLDSIK